MPATQWLGVYQRQWVRADVIAGITLAAYLLPAAIGDASLANLPPEAGLYACLFSGLVFWVFCSSRHTVVTVTSAISLLIGASLAGPANGDPARFAAMASATAVLVSLLAFVAWLLGAGMIVNFISESVMLGFKCGVALFLVSTQLPKLLGFQGSHGGFWERSAHLISHLGETNPTSLAIGMAALGILVGGRIVLRHKPVALLVVVAGIAAAPLLGLEARGVSLLGDVPRGLPLPRLPAVRWEDWNELLPLAFACFLLSAVETAAIGRMFIAKHGGRLDCNQELLALSAANFAAGVGQGFPVGGGMSQSVVNENGGARTPLSGLIAAGIILLVALFLSGLLRNLPQPVLAAVVIAAVAGLFQVGAMRRLWQADRAEFVTAAAALLGVLTFGLLRGVLIGATISLVQLLRIASRPHVAMLGRIPGSRRYSDHERHPDNALTPGVVIFRPESGLVYFNIDHVRDAILDAVRAQPTRPELVVIDLSAAPRVDIQSAEALAALADELMTQGTPVQVVEARASVRDRLRAVGADGVLGGINRFSTVADVVDDFQVRRESARWRG